MDPADTLPRLLIPESELEVLAQCRPAVDEELTNSLATLARAMASLGLSEL